MESLDYSLMGMTRCGMPAWWPAVPVLLVVLALLGVSRVRRVRRVGVWYFTFGALFVTALGGLLFAMGVQNIFRGMAKTGSGGLGAVAAGFADSLFPVLLAAFGAVALAAAGAVSGARAAASPEPRSGTTRRPLLLLAVLAALLASAAITCVMLTCLLTTERLSLRDHGQGLEAVSSTLSALLLAAFITGVLAMVLSITGSALAIFSDRAGETGSRRIWIFPGLIFLAALAVALLTHHEATYYRQIAKTGALPHSLER